MNAYNLLSHIFRKAMQWGVVNANPVKGVEKHAIQARDRYVEDWELEEFLQVATPFIHAWVAFKVMTGLRQGDILALKVSALRDDGIRFKTGKNQKAGLIPWDPDLREAVRQLMACNRIQGMTVVCDRKGQPLSESAFQNRWRNVMTKALEQTKLEERFTEHDLRAKHGTELEDAGGDATENLMHSDRRTTQAYLRSKKPVVLRTLRPKMSD